MFTNEYSQGFKVYYNGESEYASLILPCKYVLEFGGNVEHVKLSKGSNGHTILCNKGGVKLDVSKLCDEFTVQQLWDMFD